MPKHQLEPETWVERYADQLLGYAAVRIPERDVAKDLVQDTFLTAMRTRDTFRGEVSEKNWLFLILRSRILDYYKKKKDVLASDIATEEEDDALFSEQGHWQMERAPKEWTTDVAIQNDEFMDIFQKCKSRLKEAHQAAFTMKYLEGIDTETICKELGISSSNYWVLIHRAKVQLRACLEKNWLHL